VDDNRRSTRQISSISLSDIKKVEAYPLSILKLSITLNKEWEICDQSGILEVSHLYKRSKNARKTQMLANSKASDTLSPNKSEPNFMPKSN